MFDYDNGLENDWINEHEENYEESERDLVDQFENGGEGNSLYDYDELPINSTNLGIALGLAEEMTLDHRGIEPELFDLDNDIHGEAISITTSQESKDPFFKFVKETCAGTRDLDEYFTKAERRKRMYKEYV